MGTPHDIWFHFTHRHPRHAAAWLRSCLPAALVLAIDWSTLRLCAEKVHGLALRLGVTDLVYEVRLRLTKARMFLVIEHRSHQDPGLHDTLVRYSVHLAHGPRRRRSSPPTPVIAVVLYHGTGALDLRPQHPKRIARRDPATARLLESLQPRLQCIGDELTALTEAQILARDLTPLVTLNQLSLRFLPKANAAQTLAAIDRWGPLLRAVDVDDGPPIGREAIAKFAWYVSHVTKTPAEDLDMTIQRHLPRTKGLPGSTAEKLYREGCIKILLRQLNRRFGPLPADIEPRLLAATPTKLDRWIDRVLDATTLDAVFAVD